MAALFTWAVGANVCAATFEWNDAGGGLWNDAAKWTLVSGSGTAPPGVGDVAEFNLPNVYSVSYSFSDTPDTWSLDRILANGGIVTIEGAGGTFSGKNTFLDLTTGDADLEVAGGHLILDDSPDHLLTVDVGDGVIVTDGILELQSRSVVNASDLRLGEAPGGTAGELLISGGTFVDTSAVFTNTIGLNGSTGMLTIQSGSATLAGLTRLAVSGVSSSTALVNVSGGSLFLDDLEMGGTVAGADATITLSNSSNLDQSGGSTISVGGSNGLGVINIEDDATLDTGTGAITINATGDMNLSGGTFQADGFLDIQGGRLDMSGGELIINNGMDAITNGGVFTLSGGTVRVAGGLAKLETSVQFGGPSDSERANIFIHDGGMAEVQFAVRIGAAAGTFGRVEVSGVGSSLAGTGGGAGADLVVGGAGDGQLEVTDGGFASFRDDFIVGEQAGANGTALVRGEVSGTRSTVDVTIGGSGASVSIGQASVGVLDIEDEALVQAGGDVFLGSQASGHGTITVGTGFSCGVFPPCPDLDATLQSGDDLWLGGGGTSAGGTGVLNVNDGGLVIVPDLMRIYAGGTLNLDDGRVEIGTLEIQGGNVTFTGGELHFSGSATFDANLIAAIHGASGSHNHGLISVVDTLTINAPFTVDTNFQGLDAVTASTLNVNAAMLQDSGDVLVDTLNLTATYTLDGGRLTLTTGSSVDTNLTFLSGRLALNGSSLTIGAGGLLGETLAVSAGQTVDNNGATTIQSSGELLVQGGNYNGTSDVTVQSGGNLQIDDGQVILDGVLLVQSGGTATNHATTFHATGVTVDPGGTLTNTGRIAVLGAGSHELEGSIGNQGTIIVSATVDVPASGLTLNGGGTVKSSTGTINGNSTGVINNVDNRLEGLSASQRLQLTDLQLIMGPSARIGGAVDLNGVALTGGIFDTTTPAVASTLGSSSTVDGTVEMTGDVSILDARVLPTGEVRVPSAGALTIDGATALDLDGNLRADAGGMVHLAAPGTYDWTGGTVSLADDDTHSVDPGASLILTTPLEFDNLTVVSNSTGFMRAVFGVEPVVETGQELQVAGTTTLNRHLVVDGGKFATGFLSNYENLDLRTGEFHLTADDFIVAASTAGPTFTVNSGATLRVEELVQVVASNRLVVSGGVIHAQGTSGSSLSNSGDVDLIDADATFVAPASNAGDLNAIDSTLTFTGGLENSGQLNLINSTVNGSVTNNASAGLSGTNTFTGDVSGDGNFTGDGTAVFQAELAPGNSPASVSFDGDVVLESTATLAIEIGGVTKGSEFDSVDIAGDVTLAGTLDIESFGGFEPSAGDTFEIMTFSSGVGEFSQHDGLGLLGDVFLLPLYSNSSLMLYAALPGDANLDGTVDGLDVNILSANFSTVAAFQSGDANGDGVVDEEDIAVISNYFGQTAAPPPPPVAGNLQAAPEPSSALLYTLGLLTLIVSQRSFRIRT